MRNMCLFFVMSFLFCLVSAQEAPKPFHNEKMHFFASEIKLLDGDFKHIQDITHEYLLSLEPDRLCSWFRREAGLTPKAQPYPGWESNFAYIIPGHILGFYFSSMAMMYETTLDPAIIQRLNYTLRELDTCQSASGDGYLSAVMNGRLAYHKVLSGNYEVSMPSFAGANEPTYIMNKITLGLYSVYTKCHLPLAKQVLVRMTDWFGKNIVDNLTEAELQKLLICEHGSLSESFVDVYEITGDNKYLKWARRLNDQRMLIPASKNEDVLPDWHANCQIQKFVGFESVYRYTGEKRYTDAAMFFWKTVVQNYSWVIGGNSTGEHFFPKEEADNRVLRNGGPESCNTVNMLRLTEALYRDYARPEMLDYYERALLNHILPAHEPEQGMVAYMTKVQPGGFKTYGTKYNSFWCCTGTGFESPAKFQKMIYSFDDKSLYVNLFIPSQLTWKERGIVITQRTSLPDEEQTELELKLDKPKTFSLKIRHPYWVTQARLEVFINGKLFQTSSFPSGFAEIKRQWKTGDKVQVKLPMKLRVEPLSSSQKFVSVSYGPVVLAAEYPSEDLKKSDYWDDNDCGGTRTSIIHNIPLENFSWFIGQPAEIERTIQKVSSSPLTFVTKTTTFPGEYRLIPFNRIHFSRYVLYFPHNSTQDSVHMLLTQKDNLEKVTVDAVKIAYLKSEQEHKMEFISSGSWTEFGYTWREAYDGGYFMYNLKCLPNSPQSLYLRFRSDESGDHTFDVLIDGHLVKTINHNERVANATKPLYAEIIPLSAALLTGREHITVKFQAKPGNTTGQVFDVRLIKADDSELQAIRSKL